MELGSRGMQVEGLQFVGHLIVGVLFLNGIVSSWFG